MTTLLLLGVATLLVIALSEPLGERVGLVAPVLLLVIGALVGVLPQVPEVSVDPEIIIHGILPPLLFSSAVAMPVKDFRRNFGSISVLSVVLVVVSSLALGLMFHVLIPDISLPLAIALGAIMSPTDAVATGIVKKMGVSERVVTILEGEGLINDASALVLLRSALAATVGSVTLLDIGASFLWAVGGALVFGWIAGKIGLHLRSMAHEPATGTVISLTVPFLASLPAEHFHASGLVAAVVAGLVNSREAARRLPPAQRLSTRQTWQSMGLILESLVFLVVGLQMDALLDRLRLSGTSVPWVFAVAAVTILAVMVLRFLVVVPLILHIKHNAARLLPKKREKLETHTRRLDEHVLLRERPSSTLDPVKPGTVEHLRARAAKRMADVQYFEDSQLGLRDGAVMWWAGMRGGITLAAAQTLPLDTPGRDVLVFLAFAVAAGSLILQGATLSTFVEWVRPRLARVPSLEEHDEVRRLIHEAGAQVPMPEEIRPFVNPGPRLLLDSTSNAIDREAETGRRAFLKVALFEWALRRIRAERETVLDARDAGSLDAGLYAHCLALLDADQARIEIRLEALRAGCEDLVED
ncbi:sodium:proton antiporter [Schaalia sp. 19OD2882]|uniref:cation:proton antiporter n=1 Tax=Schaalia sp. 19OD2882 TaxID=2794089 RepID=UPI001C1EA2A6|nr:sodium:proton antiporter [Schaalia sp. 19OD2882]QWW19735.1 sodium:proton antiporter [Schaalia sp. 19OD2882]